MAGDKVVPNGKLPRLLLLVLMAIAPPASAMAAGVAVGGVPHAVRVQYNLTSAWYRKYLDANGIPVLGSAGVSDAALLKARNDVVRMTAALPAATRALIDRKIRVVIFGRRETASSIPEFAAAFGNRMDSRFWAGFGATDMLPICGGSEANLVDHSGDEDILVHEFGHTIGDMGLAVVNPSFKGRVGAAYDAATRRGLWRNTYAGGSVSEYWAEGVQSYFSVNRKGTRDGDGVHNLIWDRSSLQTYDEGLHAILKSAFGDAPL